MMACMFLDDMMQSAIKQSIFPKANSVLVTFHETYDFIVHQIIGVFSPNVIQMIESVVWYTKLSDRIWQA